MYPVCCVQCTLCAVYNVPCVLCTVYPVCCVQCTLCAVPCVLCTVYPVCCTLCAVPCVLCTLYPVCCVQCTLCAVYSVPCVLCTVYPVWLCSLDCIIYKASINGSNYTRPDNNTTSITSSIHVDHVPYTCMHRMFCLMYMYLCTTLFLSSYHDKKIIIRFYYCWTPAFSVSVTVSCYVSVLNELQQQSVVCCIEQKHLHS